MISNAVGFISDLFIREAHQSMLDNRKVLQDRLITTESNLNTIIAKLEQQLMETEKKLKGMEKVVEFPLPEHQ